MADTPTDRPRTVVAAFYSWVGGAVLTAGLGLLLLTVPVVQIKVFGLLLIVVGLALGFLADKARRRDQRFARAAVAMAMATVAFLAIMVLFLPFSFTVIVLIGLAVIALIAGSVLNQTKTSQDWYQAEGSA